MNTIQTNIDKILKTIRQAEIDYNREPDSVKLLAASKSQSIDKIRQAHQAGQIAFGENYLQEALEKMQLLTDLDLEWHFIGNIQANKTRKIAESFSWVHSINSLKIANRLNEQRPHNLLQLNVLIEVNIEHELSKSGIDESDVIKIAKHISQLKSLKLRGLMAIPKLHQDFSEQQQVFAKIKFLYDALIAKGYDLDTLSMGMSQDYVAAISQGATMVRIGTSLFGPRN